MTASPIPVPSTIRRATDQDIPALHGLVEGAYRGDSARRGWTHEADLLDGQRTDPETLAALLADPSQTVLLALTADGAVLGSVCVSEKSDLVARLGLLAVDPRVQAGGLGRALIAAAEDHARKGGVTVMEMTVIEARSELVAWYVRRGYHDTGRREPFPLDDPKFGLPRTRDLRFVVLAKTL